MEHIAAKTGVNMLQMQASRRSPSAKLLGSILHATRVYELTRWQQLHEFDVEPDFEAANALIRVFDRRFVMAVLPLS
jgi:hypothetical protein